MALILDTSVLLGALDKNDPDHRRCRDLIESTTERRVVPAPVLVELDYWCSQKLTVDVFAAFIDDILVGAFDVEDLMLDDYRRARQLYRKYADNRVGFVDASVLAITERLGEPKLATLDHRHFATMVPAHVAAVQLLPDNP